MFYQTFSWILEVTIILIILNKGNKYHIFGLVLALRIAHLIFDLALVVFASFCPLFSQLEHILQVSDIFSENVIGQMNQLDYSIIIDEKPDFFIRAEAMVLILLFIEII